MEVVVQPLTVENTELHFSSIYGTVYDHNKLSETHVTTTSNHHGKGHYSTSTTSKIMAMFPLTVVECEIACFH